MYKILRKRIVNQIPLGWKHTINKYLIRYRKWPSCIMVEPTNFCNLACHLCPTYLNMKRPKGFMSFKTFKFIADDIAGKIPGISLNYAGEPTLNKMLWRFVRYASDLGINTYVGTNSTLLTKQIDKILDSGLNRLVICLDGATKEVHEMYRRKSNFETICKGIQLLCEAKKARNNQGPYINLQCILTSYNESQIDSIIGLAKQLGVDSLSFKSLSLSNALRGDEKRYKEAKKWLPCKDKYRRYRISNGKVFLKNVPNKCYTYQSPLILWNGDMTICCQDWNGKYAFMNVLKEGGLCKVLTSQKWKEVKKKIKFKQFELCKKCNVSDLQIKVREFKKRGKYLKKSKGKI